MNDSLPSFPTDYVPEVAEFYDELGLLLRVEQMTVVHKIVRPDDFCYQYISGYFDGQLGILVSQEREIFSRVIGNFAFNEIVQLAKDVLK